MRPRRMSAIVAGAVFGVLASGCASQSGDPAADRAHHFYAALAAEDGAAACADLAPAARTTLERQEGKPCKKAILDQHVPTGPGTGEVQVHGSMAQVAYARETAFLSRYGDRWLLTAAGCPPVSGDERHECAIEVG